ncbi:MAG TPA: ThuA domain-containing protein [Chryseolinea sp.]
MIKRSLYLFAVLLSSALLLASRTASPEEQLVLPPKVLKALIIDGQSNHGIWPKTTAMMKDYLEQTGLFTVDVERTAFAWVGPHNDGDTTLGKEKRLLLLEQYPAPGSKKVVSVEQPKADPDFRPDFSKYDVVISNFGWQAAPWPKETQEAFEKYIKGGGGFVLIHAADNSFGDWVEFNKIIGMGAWGDRNEKSGPYVYYDKNNNIVRDTTKGTAGSHGRQHEFVITIRDRSHPVTKGMPLHWLHAQDEMYDRLRGPAENMKILATAYSDEEKNASFFSPLRGTSRNEPMMLTVNYGKGRVFHTPLGHADYSMECVGFITLLQRGAEWAATGKVSTKIPPDFPTAEKVSQRKWEKSK